MIQHPFIRRSKIGKLLSLVCCISAGKTYTGLPVLMLLSLLLVVAGRLINLLLLLIPASSMEHNLLLAQPTVQRHRVGPAGSQHLAAQGERGRRSKCEPFDVFNYRWSVLRTRWRRNYLVDPEQKLSFLNFFDCSSQI